MIALNLIAETNEDNLIKDYLENNVSETLAYKINNGVEIIKDTTLVLNKKDLKGFWQYAQSEARKLADNGKQFACVEEDTIFGWAIHYFEESSIEGKLYNLDGTEYKPEIKQVNKPKVEVKKEPEKPKNTQGSFFDFTNVEESKQEIVEPINEEVLEYEDPDVFS